MEGASDDVFSGAQVTPNDLHHLHDPGSGVSWHLCWSLGFNGHAGGGFGKAQALMSHPLLMDLDELDFVLDP